MSLGIATQAEVGRCEARGTSTGLPGQVTGAGNGSDLIDSTRDASIYSITLLDLPYSEFERYRTA